MKDSSEPIRIGELLVEQGVLSEQQVFEVVEAQRRTGEPFGVIAERLFDVTSESIEKAWAEQYHRFTGDLDLSAERFDPRAMELVTRRQAWQFELIPIRFDHGGELLIAASQRRLPRAVTFVARQLEHVTFFRITDTEQLRTYLQRYYPMPEISADLLKKSRELAHDRPPASRKR